MSESPWPIRATQTQVIRRARCPICGTTNVETYSTRSREDGRQVRYYRCRECRDMRSQQPTTFKAFVV